MEERRNSEGEARVKAGFALKTLAMPLISIAFCLSMATLWEERGGSERSSIKESGIAISCQNGVILRQNDGRME